MLAFGFFSTTCVTGLEMSRISHVSVFGLLTLASRPSRSVADHVCLIFSLNVTVPVFVVQSGIRHRASRVSADDQKSQNLNEEMVRESVIYVAHRISKTANHLLRSHARIISPLQIGTSPEAILPAPIFRVDTSSHRTRLLFHIIAQPCSMSIF